MKRFSKLNWLFAILLTLCISQSAFSQTLNEFFNNSELHLTYLGVDFSKAHLINDPTANSFDVRSKVYPAINSFVVGDPKKFDIAGAFHKTNVSSDLAAVNAKNEKINAEQIMSTNTEDFNHFTEADITAAVKSLNISGKTGIGLLIVMEGMKKMAKAGEASMWVVLIDLKTKKMLMTERFENKASGFGLRNYWSSTIRGTLEDIEKKKYKEWKAKYGTSSN